MSQLQNWMSMMSWDWMVVQQLVALGFAIVPKLLWAIVLLLLTRLVRKLVQTIARQILVRVEPTIQHFLVQMVGILVWVIGGVAALNTLGIETTTIVAIVGAAGLAIGLALQNSLSHFAAGILLISFRPFEVGDAIECSGVSGTVLNIGLFSTTIATADNTRITVPNGTLFGGTLKNFTAMKTRRVDFKVDLRDRPVRQTSTEILNLVGRHPTVLATPKPVVQLVGLGQSDRTLVWVRVWCQAEEYDAVKGDLLLTIKEYLERG
jgi:small conductance mechanosensitive channel